MKFLLSIALFLCLSGPCRGQKTETTHRFTDRTNVALWSAISVSRGLDLHSTWRFRRHGHNESFLTNRFVDDKPTFSAFSAGTVALHVYVAHHLHKKGHHRWERAISIVHIGVMSYVVARNYRL